jgi:hypothetical protein
MKENAERWRGSTVISQIQCAHERNQIQGVGYLPSLLLSVEVGPVNPVKPRPKLFNFSIAL